ncbi:MAG: aminotransferase class V-fold PLP-dependent enzyme [Aridibacter famidurans]|nr:aminotransferase class V-fold PLP-dependent enzyme [Aridibacter famidurans]
MNETIRSQFPALKQYAYLNSAAVSPIPVSAIEAVNSQLWDVAENGSTHYPEWVATKNRARALVAEMLKAQPEQVAFTRNTSDGFASVASAIDWEPTDNIVTFHREFPANFYAWRSVRDRYGVDLRLCPERDGRIDLDEFVGLIDENTRLVSISAVQFASGFRADLKKLGTAAREVGALFSVDIIQGLGAMEFDLPACHVDIASGASHKWLCAPEGCGILYVSDRARQMLTPSLVGWISVEEPWDFKDLDQSYKPNALAWESGTGASSLFYGLEQSLKLLTETGISRIEGHLSGLTDRLCEGLSERGYAIVSSRLPGESSQIVSVRPAEGNSAEEAFRQLEAEKIIVSARSGIIRVSPHFYNVADDIDRLLEALP